MLIAFDIIDTLNAAGCDVIGPFADVSEAVGAAATRDVDLAVLDINLRGTAVWPLADALQDRYVPFLFLTGYPNIDRTRNMIWLEKPFDSDTLLASLATLRKTSEVATARACVI
ncbi:MAG: response regulator [Xanthobacteraceae bacterium]